MKTTNKIIDSNEADLCNKKKTYKWDIIWTNVILLGLLHMAAIYGCSYKLSAIKWQSVIFGKTVATLSALGVTAGAHRLWTHKTYKANTFVQILLACMMTLTHVQSIYLWARDHRLHHKFSETDADPHNAKRGFFFSHMGWLMLKKHPDVKEKGKTIDMSDLKANPVVMFQHKYYNWMVLFFGVTLTVFVPVLLFAETFVNSIFTLTIYRYVISVHLIWCINSLAHLYGNKPYDKTIGPTENSMMKVCSLGEGYHNYHHTFPHDYKAAEFGGDIRNLTTALIDGFAWCGWVTDRQEASREAVTNVVNRQGDGSNRNYSNFKNIFYVIILFYIM